MQHVTSCFADFVVNDDGGCLPSEMRKYQPTEHYDARQNVMDDRTNGSPVRGDGQEM